MGLGFRVGFWVLVVGGVSDERLVTGSDVDLCSFAGLARALKGHDACCRDYGIVIGFSIGYYGFFLCETGLFAFCC